jgi:hypothetical protein
MGASHSVRSTVVVGSSVSVSGLARAEQSLSILEAVSVRAAIRASSDPSWSPKYVVFWPRAILCFCEEMRDLVRLYRNVG